MNEKFSDNLALLIRKGQEAIATYHPPQSNRVNRTTLNVLLFNEWRTQAKHFIESSLGSGHIYSAEFENATNKGAYRSVAQSGMGVLNAIASDFQNGSLDNILKGSSAGQAPLVIIEQICSRFQLISNQLSKRYNNRPSLSLSDEYDVQDLLHSLLWLHFDDVRAEEWTPSYAGKSSRMDFLLKPEQIVVEAKKTRVNLKTKEIGSQLTEDIARYSAHSDCKILVCFVYDPDRFVHNPRGIEHDLGQSSSLPVKAFIRPK